MSKHRGFMTRLIALVEYAERNGMTEAALVLTAATEVIAPTLCVETSSLDTATADIVYLNSFKLLRA